MKFREECFVIILPPSRLFYDYNKVTCGSHLAATKGWAGKAPRQGDFHCHRGRALSNFFVFFNFSVFFVFLSDFQAGIKEKKKNEKNKKERPIAQSPQNPLLSPNNPGSATLQGGPDPSMLLPQDCRAPDQTQTSGQPTSSAPSQPTLPPCRHRTDQGNSKIN